MKTTKLKKIIRPLGIVVVIAFILVVLIDNFIMPSYVQRGKTTAAPDVIGLPIGEAKKKLLAIGLEPKEAEYKTDNVIR